METLFEVAYMMVDKAEVATFHLEGEDEIAEMGFFTLAVLLVFAMSVLRWLVSTTLKFLKK